MVVEHVIKEWLTLKQRMLNLLTDSIYRVWNPLILAIFYKQSNNTLDAVVGTSKGTRRRRKTQFWNCTTVLTGLNLKKK